MSERCFCCEQERESLGKNGYGQSVCGECFEDCPRCSQGEVKTRRNIDALVEWLDEKSSPMEERENLILRVFKVVEEMGEVSAAVIGATGQNPRKGYTHSWEHVSEELCDVVAAAMVALASINRDDWQDRLEYHFAGLLDRAGLRPALP